MKWFDFCFSPATNQNSQVESLEIFLFKAVVRKPQPGFEPADSAACTCQHYYHPPIATFNIPY